MTKIFNGKAYAAKLEKEIKVTTTPKLVAILIGNNKASEIYLNLKQKAAERIGAKVEVSHFDEGVRQSEVIRLIKQLNNDSTVHGIMVQLPVPLSWNKQKIFMSITPRKDVDGLREDSPYLPATVAAILKIIKEAAIKDTDSIVIVGSEGEVGSRLVKTLRSQKYSVMEVDIDTQNPLEVTRMADVIISVTGKPNLIKSDWVKKDAVIIDVGAPKPEIDVSAAKKARFVTPVPGGVGPVTVVSLLENLAAAASRAH